MEVGGEDMLDKGREPGELTERLGITADPWIPGRVHCFSADGIWEQGLHSGRSSDYGSWVCPLTERAELDRQV